MIMTDEKSIDDKIDRLVKAEQHYSEMVKYWTDSARSNPSMADYCDNEVLAEHRYLEQIRRECHQK
jgi:hypothetical protein